MREIERRQGVGLVRSGAVIGLAFGLAFVLANVCLLPLGSLCRVWPPGDEALVVLAVTGAILLGPGVVIAFAASDDGRRRVYLLYPLAIAGAWGLLLSTNDALALGLPMILIIFPLVLVLGTLALVDLMTRRSRRSPPG